MSLGQLTADYADSDGEEDLSTYQIKTSGGAGAIDLIKEAPPPPSISPIQDSPLNKSSKDDKIQVNQNVDAKEKSPVKKIDDQLSPASSPVATAAPGLSGVIIDDDDDADDEENTPHQPSSSPPNLRVGELRASEGGSGRATPPSNPGSVGSGKNTPIKKVNRLVSYYNEEEDAEDTTDTEEEDEVLHSEPMDTGTDGDDDNSQQPSSGGSRGPSHSSSPHNSYVTATGSIVIGGIKLPPPPQGKRCSQGLQDKIKKIISGLRRGHKDYNITLQSKKEFRNPSIYEKLVDHLRLNENGTNYPVALYDPHCWGKESYYEELARVQKEEMDKREKERKERTKVDFVSGTKKTGGAEEEIKKRKSRFDAGRPDTGTVGSTVSKPVGLVASLPAVPKTTIDAFGSLAKKVKS